jgi:hypothetical protein
VQLRALRGYKNKNHKVAKVAQSFDKKELRATSCPSWLKIKTTKYTKSHKVNTKKNFVQLRALRGYKK